MKKKLERSSDHMLQTQITKKRSASALTLPITIAALACSLLNDLLVADPSVTPNKSACCVKESVGTGAISDRSLYQLESTWTNDAGAAIKLPSLSGRPQIVTMFFARCQFACPLLVHDMSKIEAALPVDLKGKIGFVLVSFDSDQDTPEALAQFRRDHELPSNWTLLRGAPDDVLELSALLGVKFKKDSAGQFAHSNVITLLNTKGEIVYQQIGLNRDPAQLIAALEKAL